MNRYLFKIYFRAVPKSPFSKSAMSRQLRLNIQLFYYLLFFTSIYLTHDYEKYIINSQCPVTLQSSAPAVQPPHTQLP